MSHKVNEVMKWEIRITKFVKNDTKSVKPRKPKKLTEKSKLVKLREDKLKLNMLRWNWSIYDEWISFWAVWEFGTQIEVISRPDKFALPYDLRGKGCDLK